MQETHKLHMKLGKVSIEEIKVNLKSMDDMPTTLIQK